MEIKEVLKSLSNAFAIGSEESALNVAVDLLKPYCKITRLKGLSCIAEIKGESEKCILIDAHIDEVGFIVTNVAENGFVTVAKCGGIDLRHLPSKRVIIHAKRKVTGVFVATPPHLSKGDCAAEDIADIKIDTGIKNARDVISVGDYVTYEPCFAPLLGNRVCGKALDNRAGVAALVLLAQRLNGKKLPYTVKLLLSDAEELGLRGAKTAVFGQDIESAVAVDVSFGDGPDIKTTECGKLGGGAMVGISPILDRAVCTTLINIAESYNIKHQTEVMGGKTSTNADVISASMAGVKTGLVSIPIRNMHTNVEVLDVADVISVADILEQYCLKGGKINA